MTHGLLSASSFAFVTALALAGCQNNSSTTSAAPPATGSVSAAPAASAAAAPAPDEVASCDTIKMEGLCRQYGTKNIQAAGADYLKKLCGDNLMGAFAMQACPSDKRVGACVTREGTKVYYNAGPAPLTADAAQKSCKQGEPPGDWQP